MPQDFSLDRKRYSICGDAKRMASDMDRALHRILAEPCGMNEARARADIEELAQELAERDRKDVH